MQTNSRKINGVRDTATLTILARYRTLRLPSIPMAKDLKILVMSKMSPSDILVKSQLFFQSKIENWHARWQKNADNESDYNTN